MSLLSAPKPFLQTNAWQHPQANSLRYNTSQAGSVLPLGYGTFRQQVNLIDFGDYRGPKGKKGKTGPLPIQGQHAGKGGGSGSKKGVGGKKNSDFSIDVAFALCQGPVDILDRNKVWSSAGIAFFQSVGLNLYPGTYTQAADPVLLGLGRNIAYAGTCYVTGTPMDLGSSPVLPNLSFEVTGFEAGTAGALFPYDANPANIVRDFLTNLEHGAEFPSANLDPDLDTNYGAYCQAAWLVMSPVLQVQTEAASWLNEIAKLTNTAIVFSGKFLRFKPYGDLALDSNGATWTPNLVPEYSFTDGHFLPWNPYLDPSQRQEGEDDPVLLERTNPTDMVNWLSVEYLPRLNSYNKDVVPQFDQQSIDTYGLRTQPSVQGNCFCEISPASAAATLLLQRSLYVRNRYKFQVGWRFMRLEPMDIVLITDDKLGLSEQAVRVLKIEENRNGDLSIEAEEITTSDTTPVALPVAPKSIYVNTYSSTLFTSLTGATDGPKGIFSIDVFPEAFALHTGQRTAGLFRHYLVSPFYLPQAFGVSYSYLDGSLGMRWGGSIRNDVVFATSGPDVVVADGHWHNLLISWDMSTFSASCCYDGASVPLTINPYYLAAPFSCAYSGAQWEAFSGGNYTPTSARYFGGVQDLYFNIDTDLDLTVPANVAKFWSAGLAVDLGASGELPTGAPPVVFLHYDGSSATSTFDANLGTGGDGFHWYLPYSTFSSNPYGT